MESRTSPGEGCTGTKDGDNRHASRDTAGGAGVAPADRGASKARDRIGSLKQTIVGLAKIFGDGILDAGLLDLVDRKSPFQSCSLRALLGKLSLLTPKLAIEVGISEAISTASCRKRQNSLSER
jgi:hypothetical protein